MRTVEQHYNHHKSLAGFTLLEMMLVIAIIAVITLLGLSGWDQIIMNRKIQTASVEMQMWLQAGLKYYAENNGSFPTSAQEIITANLMPATSLYNPWDTDQSATYNVQPDPNNANLLQVSTSIPATVTYSTAIARMLAGTLPFGVNPANTTEVYMDVVPPPGLIAQNSNIVNIVPIAAGSTPQPIPMPACQTEFGMSYQPEIYYALNSVSTLINNTPYVLRDIQITTTNPTPTSWLPNVTVNTGTSSLGTAGVTAIVMCQKISSSLTSNNNNKNNYVF